MDTVTVYSLFFIRRLFGFSVHAEMYQKGWNYKRALEGKTILWETVGKGEYELWVGRFHAYISDERIDRRKKSVTL